MFIRLCGSLVNIPLTRSCTSRDQSSGTGTLPSYQPRIVKAGRVHTVDHESLRTDLAGSQPRMADARGGGNTALRLGFIISACRKEKTVNLPSDQISTALAWILRSLAVRTDKPMSEVFEIGLTDCSLGAHESRTTGILLHQIVASMLEKLGNTKIT